MAKMQFNTELSLRRLERIQEFLRGGVATVQEIADSIHMSKRWAYEYVNYLHGQRKIYISSYRRVIRTNKSGLWIPVYRWGEGKDAVRPAARTMAENSRKYRRNPERRDDILEQKRKSRRLKSIVPIRDWTAAWIPNKEAA